MFMFFYLYGYSMIPQCIDTRHYGCDNASIPETQRTSGIFGQHFEQKRLCSRSVYQAHVIVIVFIISTYKHLIYTYI